MEEKTYEQKFIVWLFGKYCNYDHVKIYSRTRALLNPSTQKCVCLLQRFQIGVINMESEKSSADLRFVIIFVDFKR